MIIKRQNEFDETGFIAGRVTECDMSSYDLSWIELAIGALGALAVLLAIYLIG